MNSHWVAQTDTSADSLVWITNKIAQVVGKDAQDGNKSTLFFHTIYLLVYAAVVQDVKRIGKSGGVQQCTSDGLLDHAS